VGINGKPVTKLQVQSPPGATSLIGLYAESGDQPDARKFNDLKVINVK
jgi:hypothetical protein